jgi:hypothetical protein
LKNVLAPKSSAAISHTDGAPPVMTSPKATVSAHCSAVNGSTRRLRPMPRRTDTSDSQPPIGNPRMPAPALKAAINAERPNDECAASATIDTDQNEKNHRFHSTAMNATLMSHRSRERSTGPSSSLLRAKMPVTARAPGRGSRA